MNDDDVSDELKSLNNAEIKHNAEIVLRAIQDLERGAEKHGLHGDVQVTMSRRMYRAAIYALADLIAHEVERRVAEDRANVTANARATKEGFNAN